MEWIAQVREVWGSVKKYRYVVLVICLGIFLMAFPEQKETQTETASIPLEEPLSLQDALSQILSQIQGAGRVEVLLTQAQGEQVIYQSDESVTTDNRRRDTVLVTNSQREETGLIRQVNPPVYQGALVVCQGADDAKVRLSIVEAVMRVTGLTSDHITVLKMK